MLDRRQLTESFRYLSEVLGGKNGGEVEEYAQEGLL
jgi:hypothetical protein